MKKILFYNSNSGGVNYYRTSKPAIKLQEMYPEEYHVTIKDNLEGFTMEKLSEFAIIHFHNTLADFHQMPTLFGYLQAKGVKMVLDLDDYWILPKSHQKYTSYQKYKVGQGIVNNIRMADAVTVSTEYLADKVKKFNKNVIVLPNAVDLTEKQFSYGHRASTRTRIGWLGGSTHLEDLKLLEGLSAQIFSNPDLATSTQVRLYGFDKRHTITKAQWKPGFLEFLKSKKIASLDLLRQIVANDYQLEGVRGVSSDIASEWKGDIVEEVTEQLPVKDTMWAAYERIMTDNYRIIRNQKYLQWLKTYNTDKPMDNDEHNYVRIPTTDLRNYANGYRTMDIALAPLKANKKPDHRDNQYIFSKSPLKLIEAGAHKVAVVASKVPPYQVKGLEPGKHLLYVKSERQGRDWYKQVAKLLKDKSRRADMGQAIYEFVCQHYTLDQITAIRSEFYLDLCK